MANDHTSNLRPVRSKAEASERGYKGGIASGEARRRRKTFREIAEALSEKKIKIKGKNGKMETITYGVAVIMRQYEKAYAKGSTEAAKFLANLMGEEQMAQMSNTVYNVTSETAKNMQDLEQSDI